MWVAGDKCRPTMELRDNSTVGGVWALLAFGPVFPMIPQPHTRFTFPVPNVGYSADNSCRAISTRSLKVRSRTIWRSTLSTL